MTDCIEEPQGTYPDEPSRPAPGQPITDAYVQRLIGWGNQVLGVATTDRLLWRGERRCLRKLEADGQIR